MPTSSVAVALTMTVPSTVAPADGVTSPIDGAVTSFVTVTLTVLAVVTWSAASRATAEIVWAPLTVVEVDPLRLVRSVGIGNAQRRAIEEELHAGDADVVGGRRGDRDRATDASSPPRDSSPPPSARSGR